MDSRQKCITLESRIREWAAELFTPDDLPEVIRYFEFMEIAEMVRTAVDEEA